MKRVLLFVMLFVISTYSQELNKLKTQTINLEALKDTSDTFLDNQPFGEKPNPYFKMSIRTGNIVFENKNYKCAIFNIFKEIKYNYTHLWIDTLANGKYDFWKDFLEEIWVPFTLFGKSYKVTKIDSLGNYITVTECDPVEFPPIQVGFKAPNIEFTTIKNENMVLYSFNNKFKVLYFWGCNPIMPAREMKKVINHFMLKDLGKNIDFINSSWEPYEDDKQGYPWTHFYNRPTDKQRLVFQVGSLHQIFVMDENNNIVLIWRGDPRAKGIIEAIEQIIPM